MTNRNPNEHHPYTFVMRGGEPVVIRAPGNPPLRHEGGTGVVTLMVTEQQADMVVAMLEKHFVRVVVNGPQWESDEQVELRRRIDAVQRLEAADFPTPLCPLCPWFDPLHDDHEPCGYSSWNMDSRETFYRTNEAARDALVACPIKTRTE